MANTLQRALRATMVRRFSTQALVETKPGEIGMVSGIPQEHLRRRALNHLLENLTISSPNLLPLEMHTRSSVFMDINVQLGVLGESERLKDQCSIGLINRECERLRTPILIIRSSRYSVFVVIYSPARTASQQGSGKVGRWKINFLSTQKWENPLMGWTSTGDPYAHVGDSALTFDSAEAAKAFAEKHGWEYSNTAICFKGPGYVIAEDYILPPTEEIVDNTQRTANVKKRHTPLLKVNIFHYFCTLTGCILNDISISLNDGGVGFFHNLVRVAVKSYADNFKWKGFPKPAEEALFKHSETLAKVVSFRSSAIYMAIAPNFLSDTPADIVFRECGGDAVEKT
ncbi:hypothetical protein V8G54_000400 [Vigna mungo]|uniref:NADH dehydrogenase [ubiquinone] iron-sulfur protein 4, mitochondrial n=1 Tax=Vigna mungo TaxID=3915 RepID=A0AAQ3SAJ7_VIGMU